MEAFVIIIITIVTIIIIIRLYEVLVWRDISNMFG